MILSLYLSKIIFSLMLTSLISLWTFSSLHGPNFHWIMCMFILRFLRKFTHFPFSALFIYKMGWHFKEPHFPNILCLFMHFFAIIYCFIWWTPCAVVIKFYFFKNNFSKQKRCVNQKRYLQHFFKRIKFSEVFTECRKSRPLFRREIFLCWKMTIFFQK